MNLSATALCRPHLAARNVFCTIFTVEILVRSMCLAPLLTPSNALRSYRYCRDILFDGWFVFVTRACN